MAVKEKVQEVVDEVVKVHTDFEGEIDPWLEKWVKSPMSGWIACGFGMALLSIGGFVGFALGQVM